MYETIKIANMTNGKNVYPFRPSTAPWLIVAKIKSTAKPA